MKRKASAIDHLLWQKGDTIASNRMSWALVEWLQRQQRNMGGKCNNWHLQLTPKSGVLCFSMSKTSEVLVSLGREGDLVWRGMRPRQTRAATHLRNFKKREGLSEIMIKLRVQRWIRKLGKDWTDVEAMDECVCGGELVCWTKERCMRFWLT